jgi:hypothetical protein
VPASAVLKCYDWAIAQREASNCVISGFHSQLKKDVLHYILKDKQPIIIALARGLKEKLEPELQKPFDEGRLLIITPFEKTIKQVTEQTAATRNKMMINLADSITVGFASASGQLEELLKGIEKPIIKIVLTNAFCKHIFIFATYKQTLKNKKELASQRTTTLQ